MSNVRNAEETTSSKPKTTLFGPWIEQPKSVATSSGTGAGTSGSTAATKKPLPVEKKVIGQDVVQGWVDRSKDVSFTVG